MVYGIYKIALLLLAVGGLSACDLISPDKPSLRLSAEPVSSVEMLLDIRGKPGSIVTLRRDGQLLGSFTLSAQDTFWIDNGLHPATSYTWQAHTDDAKPEVEVTAATLDTTSSNFTWQRFEFGEVSSNRFQDVAIINENNIWAVGQFYLEDEHTLYNAAHWNGETWEIIRIPYYYEGQPFYSPIRAVHAFGENDIWFGIGNLIHWDGEEFNAIEANLDMLINQIWGRSSEDLYVVGTHGSVGHYDGATWRKLESGTQAHFSDIYGAQNHWTGRWEVLAVAADPTVSFNMAVVKIEAHNVIHVNIDGMIAPINSVWFVPDKKYMIGGNHVYQSYEVGRPWLIDQLFDLRRTESKAAIRGNGLNDIIVSGSFGLLKHFNGARWHHYEDKRLEAGAYGSIDIKGDLVAISGLSEGKGIVLIGKRNNPVIAH